MKKSIKSILALASGLAVLATSAVAATLSASAADEGVNFTVSNVQLTLAELAAQGNKVTLNVAVSSNEEGFTGYNFRIGYDEKLTDVTLEKTGKVSNVLPGAAGVVVANFADAAQNVVTGDADLFKITLTVPDDAAVGDKYDVFFDVSDYGRFFFENANDPNVTTASFKGIDGFIEIIDEEETTVEDTTTTTPAPTEVTTTTATDESPKTGSNVPFVELAAVAAVIGGAVAIATKKRK